MTSSWSAFEKSFHSVITGAYPTMVISYIFW